jgi:hypothetical protein
LDHLLKPDSIIEQLRFVIGVCNNMIEAGCDIKIKLDCVFDFVADGGHAACVDALDQAAPAIYVNIHYPMKCHRRRRDTGTRSRRRRRPSGRGVVAGTKIVLS